MLGIPDTYLFAAQMIPERGCIVRMESDTNAKGARVLVDGEFFSSIPCGVELRPGEHLIVVQKDGFETWSKKIRIAPTDLTLLVDVHIGRLAKKVVTK
jgi:PEGA domain